MKKLLTIAIIALTVSASAQTTFDHIERTTRDNHTQLVPTNFKQFYSDTAQVTYTDGKDFMYFNFTKGKFTSLAVTNMKHGVDVSKYRFETQFSRGGELKVYDKDALVHIMTVNGRERIYYYNRSWVANELAMRPNKYLGNKAWF